MSTSCTLVAAAIDIGTTHSGYAFSFKHEYDADPLKITSTNWETGFGTTVSIKTPTCVLFDKDKVFHSFGYEAEEKYLYLALDEEHQEWYFFKNFITTLFNKKVRFLFSLYYKCWKYNITPLSLKDRDVQNVIIFPTWNTKENCFQMMLKYLFLAC